MDVALNDCIRRIFSYNRWESTRELRRGLGYDSITEIFAKRKLSFERSILTIANSVLVRLHNVNQTLLC